MLQVMRTQTGTVHVLVDGFEGLRTICGVEWTGASTTTERVSCRRCEKAVEYVARRLPLGDSQREPEEAT